MEAIIVLFDPKTRDTVTFYPDKFISEQFGTETFGGAGLTDLEREAVLETMERIGYKQLH